MRKSISQCMCCGKQCENRGKISGTTRQYWRCNHCKIEKNVRFTYYTDHKIKNYPELVNYEYEFIGTNIRIRYISKTMDTKHTVLEINGRQIELCDGFMSINDALNNDRTQKLMLLAGGN